MEGDVLHLDATLGAAGSKVLGEDDLVVEAKAELGHAWGE